MNLIPFGQFKKATGLDPERYQRAHIKKGGHRYIRWDRGAIDEVADALGLTDTQLVDRLNRRAQERRNPRKKKRRK